MIVFVVFFFKQKTAYDVRISDWSSDVCSSDLNFDMAVASDPSTTVRPGQTASSISSLVTTSPARSSSSCSTSSGLPSSATARPSTRSAQLASSKSALAKCHRRRLRRDEWVPDIEITAPRSFFRKALEQDQDANSRMCEHFTDDCISGRL